MPILAKGCRAVTEFGAELGVATTVENHGFFAQDSDRCEQLMKAVGHKNFGSLVDFGNFLCADENPVAAVTRMAPYAKHCHAKDFHIKAASEADPGRGGAYILPPRRIAMSRPKPSTAAAKNPSTPNTGRP